MFLQTDPPAAPEVFYGPVSRVNPRRGGRISPWHGWGIPELRFNSQRRRDGGRVALAMCAPPPGLNFATWARGGWKLRHVDTPEPQSSPRHCVKAEGAPRRRVLRDQCGRGGRVESAIVCYLPPPPPRFYSSLSGKESRNPGREPERNT